MCMCECVRVCVICESVCVCVCFASEYIHHELIVYIALKFIRLGKLLISIT